MRHDLNDFDALLGADSRPVSGSAEELAELLGISARAVREHATRGIIVKLSKGAYDVPASVRAYCAHLREQAAGRTGSASLTAERIRATKAQADTAELKNAALRGELVRASEVQSTWAGILRDVRAALLAVSARCGATLPHLTPHDVAEIDQHIRDTLTEIAE